MTITSDDPGDEFAQFVEFIRGGADGTVPDEPAEPPRPRAPRPDPSQGSSAVPSPGSLEHQAWRDFERRIREFVAEPMWREL